MDLNLKTSWNKYVFDNAPEDPKLAAMDKHFEKWVHHQKLLNWFYKNENVEKKNDVCHHENKCKVSLNKVQEVKNVCKQFQDAWTV